METVDFYPKTFHEIPEQDNPAFNNQECLMVVKDFKNHHAIVLHISEENRKQGDAVVHIAKFWRHDLALEYCENTPLEIIE